MCFRCVHQGLTPAKAEENIVGSSQSNTLTDIISRIKARKDRHIVAKGH